MQVIGFILGLLSVILMFIAFIPLLGWLNWLNIPFAVVGLIFALIGIATARGSKKLGIAAIILCVITILFGILKLKACGGFI